MLADLVDDDDVVVLAARGGARLDEEPLRQLRLVRLQELDRDAATKPQSRARYTVPIPPSPIILISSYWLMRTPGCGLRYVACTPVTPESEPGELPPVVLCAWRSHFDELGPMLGASLARRARPDCATVMCGTCCGSGVACGIVVGGLGSGSAPLGPSTTVFSFGFDTTTGCNPCSVGFIGTESSSTTTVFSLGSISPLPSRRPVPSATGIGRAPLTSLRFKLYSPGRRSPVPMTVLLASEGDFAG